MPRVKLVAEASERLQLLCYLRRQVPAAFLQDLGFLLVVRGTQSDLQEGIVDKEAIRKVFVSDLREHSSCYCYGCKVRHWSGR